MFAAIRAAGKRKRGQNRVKIGSKTGFWIGSKSGLDQKTAIAIR
jgi:hypothetical protein